MGGFSDYGFDTPILGGIRQAFFNADHPQPSAQDSGGVTPYDPNTSLADRLVLESYGGGGSSNPYLGRGVTGPGGGDVTYGGDLSALSGGGPPAPTALGPVRSPLEAAFGAPPDGFAWNASGGLVDIRDKSKGGSGGGGGGGARGAAGPMPGYGNDLSFEQQSALDAQKAAEQMASSSAVANINANVQKQIADGTVTVEQAKIKAGQDASAAASHATEYAAQLQSQAEDRKTQAELTIAAGNIQLGMAQMQSSERIAAAKAAVDEEIAGLNAYTQVLGFQSKERSDKATAAASIFNSLAQMAPGDNLRSAWYVLRGQAPPAPLSANLPAGLLSALGQNPDTVNAAALQMRGGITPPPWMQTLMAGQSVPTPKAA